DARRSAPWPFQRATNSGARRLATGRVTSAPCLAGGLASVGVASTDWVSRASAPRAAESPRGEGRSSGGADGDLPRAGLLGFRQLEPEHAVGQPGVDLGLLDGGAERELAEEGAGLVLVQHVRLPSQLRRAHAARQ